MRPVRNNSWTPKLTLFDWRIKSSPESHTVSWWAVNSPEGGRRVLDGPWDTGWSSAMGRCFRKAHWEVIQPQATQGSLREGTIEKSRTKATLSGSAKLSLPQWEQQVLTALSQVLREQGAGLLCSCCFPSSQPGDWHRAQQMFGDWLNSRRNGTHHIIRTWKPGARWQTSGGVKPTGAAATAPSGNTGTGKAVLDQGGAGTHGENKRLSVLEIRFRWPGRLCLFSKDWEGLPGWGSSVCLAVFCCSLGIGVAWGNPSYDLTEFLPCHVIHYYFQQHL